ncbi:MAG: ribosome-associated translation inhibitor RaiA [Gammaproteobacteria bacterium]|jgi:putative sigma-54 modulation protein|nr:ribosome-associated translation inhibitor RaiA [Gammaproteobacteria bacterium]
MHIKVDGRHVEVTESMHDYISAKLGRIERHFDHLVNVHVVLSVEKQRQMAEATIHVAGNDIHAHSEDEDMYAAIDALSDKLDRQIKKHKEKLTNHRA